MAKERAGAKLVATSNQTKGGDITEIYNPCLPGNTTESFTSGIQLSVDGHDYWPNGPGESVEYTATFSNHNRGGNFSECAALARTLLRKGENLWCDFAHGGKNTHTGIIFCHGLSQTHVKSFTAFSILRYSVFMLLLRTQEIVRLQVSINLHCLSKLKILAIFLHFRIFTTCGHSCI